ncbi:glucose dehydrogenase [Lasius niger]|uniref:Glucose dehydrogenase n=1 Tax=Lasius niger TaxID=67767 RepID=A0A0J7NER3_LASNI|nr:glucose dehydrogenase [Lasius niger]
MFSAASDYGIRIASAYALNSKTATALYKNITGDVQAFGIFPYLLRPRSRGFIKLKSSDPKEAPAIVPNYFKDPHDLQVLVRYITYTFVGIRVRFVIHNCLLA